MHFIEHTIHGRVTRIEPRAKVGKKPILAVARDVPPCASVRPSPDVFKDKDNSMSDNDTAITR
jgi:hypothetical protein